MTPLTIVVTCTDRKTAVAPRHRLIQDLPGGLPHPERIRLWQKRLADPVGTERPLLDLYKGEAWTQVKRLVTAAQTAGFDPRLRVASAGLGLRSATSLAAPYGATFAFAQPDSVAATRGDARAWWTALASESPVGSLRSNSHGQTLWVLSASYAEALEHDLIEAAKSATNRPLLVGGVRDLPGVLRLPADVGLRKSLGGTASSLILRMATAWLERLDGTTMADFATRKCWDTWAQSVRVQPDRPGSVMSDHQVRNFVATALEQAPGLSKARALRLLRDGGYACEQKRFGRLFEVATQDA